MVYDYLITLKKPSFTVVDLISQLLYLVAFSSFIFFSTRLVNLVNIYSIAAFVLVVIYIILRLKLRKRDLVFYTAGFALAALAFMIGPYSNWVISVFFLACLFFEREFKFHKEVGFIEKEVVFNTLIKKHYEWSDFNNLLIKDGIITFDFKNNQVIQKEIEGEVTPEVEEEFNSFCRQLINTKTIVTTPTEQ